MGKVLYLSHDQHIFQLCLLYYEMDCHSHLCGIYFVGVDESVDGAAFLDLSEDDVKMMVKPLGHVKRVLRLISSIKTKVMM